jgi:hypothetical protein
MSSPFGVVFDEYLETLGLSTIQLMGLDTETSASDAFATAFDGLLEMHKALTAKEESKSDTVVTPEYELAWQKDEDAKAIAHNVMVEMLTLISEYENNPAVIYHLRDAIKSSVVGYVSNELAWQVRQATKDEPKPEVVNDKEALQKRYLACRKAMFTLYGFMGHKMNLNVKYLNTEGKEITPNLPNAQGNYGGPGNGGTGRNANTYQFVYNVDGTTADDPHEAIRLIFTGKDRIGKTTTDLSKLIDENFPKANAKGGSFTYEGKKVTLTRKAK